MAMQLNAYLNFDGNCAEAMTFYGEVFRTEVKMMRFSDAPMPAAPGTENRIMHANLQLGSTPLMASDTMPGMPFAQGNNVHLSVAFTDRDEQTRVFEALAQGGKVVMPLGDQFFGRFGMLVDRFGVNWMVIMEAPHGA